MPIIPNASVKTKLDQTRSRIEWKRQFTVAPAVNILEEASALVRVPNASGTGEDVVPSTGGAGERFAGLSLQSRISAETFTWVEDLTIPNVAPYTLQLKKTTLVDFGAGQPDLAIWDYDDAAYMTYDATPPPASTEFNATLAGALTFEATQAGHSIRCVYRYNLTAIERDELLRQSHVNRGAEDTFGLMTTAFGHCWVYTSMYDATQDWAIGDPVTLAAGGLLDKGGAVAVGTVFSLPSAGDPYLGVEYNTPA